MQASLVSGGSLSRTPGFGEETNLLSLRPTGVAQAIRLKQRLGAKAEITVSCSLSHPIRDCKLITFVILQIYERHHDIGGVWTTSRWPGAGVDVPIHWYQLYSDLKPGKQHRRLCVVYWRPPVDLFSWLQIGRQSTPSVPTCTPTGSHLLTSMVNLPNPRLRQQNLN